MSKFGTVSTSKGTQLPLTDLKGKAYLMVAYRIQWFNEEVKSFRINTNYLSLSSEETVAQTTIEILDETGRVVRTAMGTKRETKKDFPDHTEKAETGAIGRAITMLGYGTQFALSDLDEGERLIDSPVVKTNPVKLVQAPVSTVTTPVVVQEVVKQEVPVSEPVKKPTFRKPNLTPQPETVKTITVTNDSDWS